MTEPTSEVVPLSGPTGRLVAAHRGQLREVLEHHGVRNARLFGSVARGDDHDGSDLDILVDFAPSTSLFSILRIQDELDDITAAIEAIRSHVERGPLSDSLVSDAVRIRDSRAARAGFQEEDQDPGRLQRLRRGLDRHLQSVPDARDAACRVSAWRMPIPQ